MKLFKSLISGLIIPLIILAIGQIFLSMQGLHLSELIEDFTLQNTIIVYIVLAAIFAAIEYYALTKKEEKQAEEEEEQERQRELQEKMNKYLDMKMKEDNNKQNK